MPFMKSYRKWLWIFILNLFAFTLISTQPLKMPVLLQLKKKKKDLIDVAAHAHLEMSCNFPLEREKLPRLTFEV